MPMLPMRAKALAQLALTAVWLPLALPPLLAAQPPNFAARRDYNYALPGLLAVGDFNGDGILDFVTANGDFVCAFGNGDGTFRPGPRSGFGSAVSIAVADFDGDGKLDLAYVDGVSSAVLLAFGNGDGTFTGPYLLPVNDMGSTIASADLNGDGRRDIIVGTRGPMFGGPGGGISVILNLGNRSFGNPTVYLSPQEAYAVAIADVNQDGIPDIAVGVQAGIALLLGAGGGSFTPGNTLTMPYPAGTIVFGDLNHDGLVDMVAGGGPVVTNPAVTVFLATGGGSFGPPRYIPFRNGSLGVAIGDVNQDGHLDLVVANGNIAEIALLLNKGNATFAAGRSYTVAVPAIGLVLAPLRQPGLLDILTAGFASDSVSVLLNRGKGIYEDGLHLPFSSGTGPPATADFNGDGHPDVAVTTGKGVSILLGTGKPLSPFRAGATISLSAYQTITGDFNGDGRQDLAVALTNGQIAVLLGRGDGTFLPPVLTGTGNTNAFYIFAGDFNGDGKRDLVTTANQILFGNGDGTFQTPRTLIPANKFPIQWIAAADFNGDGKTDLAIVEGYAIQYLVVLINAGNGVFRKPNVYEVQDTLQAQIAVADFNGDGHPDVVVSAEGMGFFTFLGNGDGTFQPPTQSPSPPFNSFGIVTGDFNGDGKQDVALSTDGSCNVAVFSGNGDGTFQAPLYFGAGPYATFLITGEFQGQPAGYKPDLVVASQNAVDVLLNRTP